MPLHTNRPRRLQPTSPSSLRIPARARANPSECSTWNLSSRPCARVPGQRGRNLVRGRVPDRLAGDADDGAGPVALALDGGEPDEYRWAHLSAAPIACSRLTQGVITPDMDTPLMNDRLYEPFPGVGGAPARGAGVGRAGYHASGLFVVPPTPHGAGDRPDLRPPRPPTGSPRSAAPTRWSESTHRKPNQIRLSRRQPRTVSTFGASSRTSDPQWSAILRMPPIPLE